MDRERSLRSVPKGEDYLDPERSRTGARLRICSTALCYMDGISRRRNRSHLVLSTWCIRSRWLKMLRPALTLTLMSSNK